MIELVFNEISLEKPAKSLQQASNAIQDMFSIADEVVKLHQQKVSILAKIFFNAISLSEDYTFQQWLTSLPKELKQRYLNYITKSPIIQEYPEYHFRGTECQGGFAYACQNDLATISYDPYSEWAEIKYLITKNSLEELEDDTEVVSEDLEVLHIPNASMVFKFEIFFRNKIQFTQNKNFSNLKNIQDFWDNRETLLPNLHFCECVNEQIQVFSIDGKDFGIIFNKLSILNEYYAHNKEKYPKDLGLNFSSESESTLNQYSQERIFQLPNGENQLFTLHIKLNSHRVYFHFEKVTQKCYIGYIGKHLRTVKYN
ncbi:MAG: hypothetical protein SFU27_12810 [Thermonemataceae bacterium]|nr:hypothetical protein [Thermonemataceae bacterium]